MPTYAVITEISNGRGNLACGELLIDPDAEKHVAGSNIIVDPTDFPETMFTEMLCRGDQTTIDLTIKQMVLCSIPVFRLGEIMVIDSNDRTIPDGRKPSKWDVGCEYFNDIESAIKRAVEVTK
jgi:hypothetical protein